jgi:superfamily II DNA helicase RecQ
LKKAAGIQLKQRALIKQHQQLIDKEIKSISQEKDTKVLAMEEKKKEREQIEKDKVTKEISYGKFKKEEQKLYDQLQVEERKKQELKRKIDSAIKNEIAVETERQRKEEERKRKVAEEKKRKANEAKKAGDKPKTSNTPVKEPDPFIDDVPEKKTEYVYKESPEGSAIGRSFESMNVDSLYRLSTSKVSHKSSARYCSIISLPVSILSYSGFISRYSITLS